MTSFIIKDHLSRPVAPSWSAATESSCAFCHIIQEELPAYKVFEDDDIIAILDILPLRRGHTLVIPKVHCARLSELPPDSAAAVGKAVSRIARALTQAVDNTALNVVCNQEYAQAVPHVHYHIIPAPNLSSPGLPIAQETERSSEPPHSIRDMHRMEFESRKELDVSEAEVLLKNIRARL